MRLLGVDFGLRRIGLAISDEACSWALPLTTLERRDDRRAARQIHRIAAEERVTGLVLGDPLGLDGESNEASERVRRFGRRLESVTGLPVELIPEALTSVEAQERLRAAGLDPRRHREKVDAVAAQILLQEALDRRPKSSSLPSKEDP
jgi:putative Holliday junction resolvase